jgi:hypothetical protein
VKSKFNTDSIRVEVFMINQGGRIGWFEMFILLKNRHSLKRVVPTMNLVKFGQIWQLKRIKIIW